jgi:hypothetical protein
MVYLEQGRTAIEGKESIGATVRTSTKGTAAVTAGEQQH